MTSVQSTPLLLLDNSNMMSVVNQGEFKCTNLSFEEAKAIIEMHEEADVLRCFDDDGIQTIIFNYLGIERREFPYKHIRNMRPGRTPLSLSFTSPRPKRSRSLRPPTAWRQKKSRTFISTASIFPA